MLFSATQTEKVAMLTQVAVKKDCICVRVDDDKAEATVDALEQGYVVFPSEDRFLFLYTFLKRNKDKKIMVFFSTNSSVIYYHQLLNYVDIPVMSICVSHIFSRAALSPNSTVSSCRLNIRILAT